MPAPSDGRAFTSYLSSGQLEDNLQRLFGVRGENQYRHFLTHNAQQVVDVLNQIHVDTRPSLPGPVIR